MPNWCRNFLRVDGPAEDVARFQKQAVAVPPRPRAGPESTPEVLSFESLVPLPAKRRTTHDGAEGVGSPKQEWGCRSDAFRSELVETWDGHVVYTFVTPWNPPRRFFQRVSERWPSLIFILDYDEPMLGYRGLARAANGALEFLHINL